jgi:hypothetical protein
MSKGRGKWQRLILSKLATREAFKLRELLGPTFTKAQYNALLRAMQRLEDAGEIKVHRFAFGGGGKIYVHLGTTFTGEDRRKYKAGKWW